MWLLVQPAMYRSIHDGRAPPTASTFNISNNTFSCGVHNVGGSTDGADEIFLLTFTRTRDQQRRAATSIRSLSTPILVANLCCANYFDCPVVPAYRKPYSSHKMIRARATFGPPRTGGHQPSDYLRRSAPLQKTKQGERFRHNEMRG